MLKGRFVSALGVARGANFAFRAAATTSWRSAAARRGMATMPLTSADRKKFEEDGFLVVQGALDKETCQKLVGGRGHRPHDSFPRHP